MGCDTFVLFGNASAFLFNLWKRKMKKHLPPGVRCQGCTIPHHRHALDLEGFWICSMDCKRSKLVGEYYNLGIF